MPCFFFRAYDFSIGAFRDRATTAVGRLIAYRIRRELEEVGVCKGLNA